METLVSVRGIGAWTSAYIALRGFSEPDVFPAADLGLRKAAVPLFGEVPTAEQLWERAERWRPWRSYAAIHLWNSLSEKEDAWT
jgi:3-methyladenine DNA glycosylase/8-oxoguanine DNA glycosylase